METQTSVVGNAGAAGCGVVVEIHVAVVGDGRAGGSARIVEIDEAGIEGDACAVLGAMLTRPNKIAVDQQLAAIFHSSSAVADEIRAPVTRNGMRPGAQRAFRDSFAP